jgi:hypothetical protein
MSLVRRGARRIVVDGQAYAWQVRRKPTYCQAAFANGLNVAIALADGGGRVLLVERNEPHPSNLLREVAVPVTPGQVADWIRQARQRGWDPRANGSAFRLKAN